MITWLVDQDNLYDTVFFCHFLSSVKELEKSHPYVPCSNSSILSCSSSTTAMSFSVFTVIFSTQSIVVLRFQHMRLNDILSMVGMSS